MGLTFDGLSANFTLVSKLGAVIDANKFQTYFLHPCTSEKVHIFINACHMLKLLRNLFCDLKVIIDVHGNVIKWDHIVAPEKLQCQEA